MSKIQNVVKGSLKVVEHGKAATYSAGEVFWESGELMSVENAGDDAAELGNCSCIALPPA